VCYSATLLAFLVELLKSSVAMQEQMLGGKGFLVIGYLLEKVQYSTTAVSVTKIRGFHYCVSTHRSTGQTIPNTIHFTVHILNSSQDQRYIQHSKFQHLKFFILNYTAE
jgi:hypothetical protein